MPESPPKPRLTKRRIFGLAAAIASLWLAWQIYDIFTGKPYPSIDYATQFHELCSNAQPEGENAWPLLVGILERVQELESELNHDPAATQRRHDATTDPGSFLDLTTYPIHAPNKRPHYRLLQVLSDEGTLDRLQALTTMSRCVRPRIEGEPFNKAYFNATTLHTGQVRALAKLQAGRLAVAAESWDWASVADITDQSLTASEFVARQPSLLEYLTAETCIELVLRELRLTLLERPLDEQTARNLLGIIDKHRDLPAPEYTMAGEHLLSLDNIQNEYTASGRMPVSTFGRFSKPVAMPGTPTPRRSLKAAMREVAAIVIPGREAAEHLDAQYIDDVVRVANATNTAERQSIDDAWISPAPLNQIIIETTAIRPSLLANCWPRVRQSIESTRIMLGIEIYTDHVGHAPNSLEDLVPDYLHEIPLDPLNGQTWGYRRMSEGSTGSMYLLWSFGEDGVDNHCEEDDGSYGLRAKPGTDIWINKPRHVR